MTNRSHMFQTPFTAWRNLWKDRPFTFLNLMVLTTGLACVILIYLWRTNEKQVDHYNANDDRLYQVLHNITTPAGIETIQQTPGLLATALAKELPEVEYAASVVPPSWFDKKGLLSRGNDHFRAAAQFVSRDYFRLFSCHFTEGDPAQLFTGKENMALSAPLARKLFHTTTGLVGKTLQWEAEGFSGTYVIAGIYEPFPENATTSCDLLFTYERFLDQFPKLLNWGNSDPDTYVLLKQGTDITAFNKKLGGFLQTKKDKAQDALFAQRFSDRYLFNRYENGRPAGGRIEYLRLFGFIAVFILLIACINFVNLSTAQASRRLKAIGIRKILGAARGMLVRQYLLEVLLLAFMALCLALLLVYAVLPLFNTITGRQLALSYSRPFTLSLLLISFITALFAGLYPALYLSGFHPVTAVKGKLRSPLAEVLARKGLVVLQFTLSAILITGFLVIHRQVRLVQTKNLGYEREQVLFFDIGRAARPDAVQEAGAYETSLESFLQQVKAIPGVVNAANFRHSITNRHGGTTDVQWQGKAADDPTAFTDIAAGYDFMETLGIRLKAGRSYSRQYGTEKGKVIFNQAAIDQMGLKDPVGKMVTIWGEEKQIIGITDNFHFESLYETIKPCFFDFSLSPRVSKIMVKLKRREEQETINRLAQFYKARTGEALDYTFLDAEYEALYASENRMAVLSRYFAAIGVILCCLGLFGLSAFSAQRRRKEIGIRKVVGATAGSVTYLLSKETLKLVLVSMVIAFPVSWWALNRWLDDFAYRVPLGFGVFFMAGLSLLVIAFVTISFQSVRAARANPVKSLRLE